MRDKRKEERSGQWIEESGEEGRKEKGRGKCRKKGKSLEGVGRKKLGEDGIRGRRK